MIVVDTSVWINFLKAVETDAVRALRRAITPRGGEVIVGDLVLLEVLQGARNDLHAARMERDLRSFRVVGMLDSQIAALTARNFRLLRAVGVRLRGTVDLIIGTFCLHHGHTLLHDDRDFEPMVRHLGLRVPS
ncbi:MAG: PIN domain nuclease [Acetobacteraceae bacterium]|nr:PIN domain nuclease [Acetobacteraceae bacterium]MBV9776135.1 PIN domain nuclease [Acetobacteraceae bacterium]